MAPTSSLHLKLSVALLGILAGFGLAIGYLLSRKRSNSSSSSSDEAKYSKDSDEARGGKNEQNTGSVEIHGQVGESAKADETHNKGNTEPAGDATPLTPGDKTATSSHQKPGDRKENVEDQCKETSSKLTLAESILAFENLLHEELSENHEVPERSLPEVVELKIEKVNSETIHDLPPGITDTPHENPVSGLIPDRLENANTIEVPQIRDLPQQTSSGVPVSNEELLNKLDDGTPNREPVTGSTKCFKPSNDAAANNEVIDVITPHNKVVGETLVKQDVHKSTNEQPHIGSVAAIKPQDENKQAHVVEPATLEETKPSLRLTKIPKRLHLTDSTKTANVVSSPTESGVSPTKEVGVKTPSKEEKSVVSDKFEAALIEDSKREKLGNVANEEQEKSSATIKQTGKTPTANKITSSKTSSKNESSEKDKEDKMRKNSESVKQERAPEVALVREDKVELDAAAEPLPTLPSQAAGTATTTSTKIAGETVVNEKKQERSEMHIFTTGKTTRETEKPKPSTAILVTKPINEASHESDKPNSSTAAPMVKPMNEASHESDKPKTMTAALVVKPINEASHESDKPKAATIAPMVQSINEVSHESDKPKAATIAPVVQPINEVSHESDKPKAATIAPMVQSINEVSHESDKPKAMTSALTIRSINEASQETDKPKPSTAILVGKPINEVSHESDKSKSKIAALTIRSINEASQEIDKPRLSSATLVVQPITPPPEKRSPKKSRERTIVPRSIRMNDHIVKSKTRSSNEMSAESPTWNDPAVRRTESESDTSPSQPWWKESEESEMKKEGPTANPWLPTRTSASDDAQSFSSSGGSVFDDNFVEPIIRSDHSHHLAASSPESHVPDLVSAAADCVLEREPLISLDEDADAIFAAPDVPMSSPKTSLTIAQDTTRESTSVEEIQQIVDIDQGNIPAMIKIIGQTSTAALEVQVASLKALADLSWTVDRQAELRPAIGHLMANLDSNHMSIKMESLKIMMNMSRNPAMVPYLLATKAPSCLLKLLLLDTNEDILLAWLNVLADILWTAKEQCITYSSLPDDVDAGPLPETVYNGLYGLRNARILKSRVFVLSRHKNQQITLLATRIYSNLISS